MPYYNAGTERFVRDWTTAVCLVAVRDSRTPEHDALLGVVPLKLSEVFKNASQVTKNYLLIGGVGQAKIRISMIWESVDYKLEKHLLGWEVGNIRITSSRLRAVNFKLDGMTLKNMKIKMYSTISHHTISRHECHERDTELHWSTKTSESSLELPITHRHASAICIEFHSKVRRGTYALSMLWLTELHDNENHSVQLPIWCTDTEEKRQQIRNNRIENDDDRRETEEIGTLRFNAIFLRGLGDSHGKQIRGDSNLRQVHEAWQATIAHGQRVRGDAFLVGHHGTDELRRGQLGPDPYAQLNSCAENAAHGNADDTNLKNGQDEAIDEDARQATNESTR